jgi:hypothetical protein
MIDPKHLDVWSYEVDGRRNLMLIVEYPDRTTRESPAVNFFMELGSSRKIDRTLREGSVSGIEHIAEYLSQCPEATRLFNLSDVLHDIGDKL